MHRVALALPLLLFLLPGLPVVSQQAPGDAMADCSMHHKAMDHQAVVKSHGDHAMGFPHDKTTHHFRLLSTGGVIEVTADQATDKMNTEAIRSHLHHLAAMFTNGDFSTPAFIHDMVPPGATTMKLLKGSIKYRYEEIPAGGRLKMESGDPVGLAAIHDFLRYQVTEHQTGDSLQIAKR